MEFSTQLAVSATLTATNDGDMAVFPLPSAFKKAHCVRNGQWSPPSSPNHSESPTAKTQATSKPLLARIFSRHLKLTMSTLPLHRSRSQSQKVETKHLRDQSSWTQKVNPPVPTSPVETGQDDPTTNQDSEPTRLPPFELRRTSLSYHNLRQVAYEHKRLLSQPIDSPPPTPLLPTPIIDDRRGRTQMASTGYFPADTSKPTLPKRIDSSYVSYEDLHILSCYEEGQDASPDKSHSKLENVVSEVNIHGFHSTSTGCSKKRSKKPSYSSIQSTESDWLANTTSYEERIRKFNSRCYQVVQHPINVDASKQEDDSKIMMATMLVGPGKPKLVQIERPSSSNGSMGSRRTPLLQPPSCSSSPGTVSETSPCTPPQHYERSAFSPYDTPSDVIPLSNSSPKIQQKGWTTDQTPMTASKLHLVPQPLSLSDRMSTELSSAGRDSFGACRPTLAEPFSPVFPSAGLMPSWSTPEQCYRLERTLEAVTRAINCFPHRMPNLDSPFLSAIRHGINSNGANQRHLSNLSNIFTETPRQLISILVAWIIIDVYISGLEGKYNAVNSPPAISSRPSATTTMRTPRRSTSTVVSVPQPASQSSTVSLSSEADASSEQLRSSPAAASRPVPRRTPRSRGSMHSIPSKARSVLGIDRPPGTRVISGERVLLAHASALRVGVGVVAQRLMEAVRGPGGWDVHLWKALTVLVADGEKRSGLDGFGGGTTSLGRRCDYGVPCRRGGEETVEPHVSYPDGFDVYKSLYHEGHDGDAVAQSVWV